MNGPLGTVILALIILALVAGMIWLFWSIGSCWSAGGTWIPNAFPQKCMMP